MIVDLSNFDNTCMCSKSIAIDVNNWFLQCSFQQFFFSKYICVFVHDDMYETQREGHRERDIFNICNGI